MNSPEMIPLTRAGNPFEARLIVALLESHEIPAFVGGTHLVDEFASSQQLLGGVGQEILVPARLLEQAQQVLRDAKQVGDEMGKDD